MLKLNFFNKLPDFFKSENKYKPLKKKELINYLASHVFNNLSEYILKYIVL